MIRRTILMAVGACTPSLWNRVSYPWDFFWLEGACDKKLGFPVQFSTILKNNHRSLFIVGFQEHFQGKHT